MMVSNLNAAASLGKVDPSPLLRHFETLSHRNIIASKHYPRECTTLSHIGSRVVEVLVYRSRQRFSMSANPSQGGTFRENFARWLASTVRMHLVKRRRAVKGLVCSRHGTMYHNSDFCGRSQARQKGVSPL